MRVPSARTYGSTVAATSWTVARSTPSSWAHRSSGAAIGRPQARFVPGPHPDQSIEHKFKTESRILPTPIVATRSLGEDR